MHLRKIRPEDVARYSHAECDRLRAALFAEKWANGWTQRDQCPRWFVALADANYERLMELWEQLPLF